MKIIIRQAIRNEWPDVLRIHRRAIHEIAAADYPIEVLRAWGPAIKDDDLPRMLDEFDEKLDHDQIVIVAEVNDCLAGFGEVVPQRNELLAIYVNPDFVRRGVGSAIIRELERLAREKNMTHLNLDASITAVPFYKAHGYYSLGRGVHNFRNGNKMDCVKMKKDLI